jgi:hypothetical protein
MAKAVESGMPKLRIEESAARKQARIDSRTGATAPTAASSLSQSFLVLGSTVDNIYSPPRPSFSRGHRGRQQVPRQQPGCG